MVTAYQQGRFTDGRPCWDPNQTSDLRGNTTGHYVDIHSLLPSTDGGFLTYACVFPGDFIGQCIRVYLHNTMIGRRITSLPEKQNKSRLLDAGHGADRTDRPTMHFESPMQSQRDQSTDGCGVKAALLMSYNNLYSNGNSMRPEKLFIKRFFSRIGFLRF